MFSAMRLRERTSSSAVQSFLCMRPRAAELRFPSCCRSASTPLVLKVTSSAQPSGRRHLGPTPVTSKWQALQEQGLEEGPPEESPLIVTAPTLSSHIHPNNIIIYIYIYLNIKGQSSLFVFGRAYCQGDVILKDPAIPSPKPLTLHVPV